MTIYRDSFVYAAASSAFTPGTTPQDVFAITGSATNNILIMKMGISTTQGTAGSNAWNIIKRSTANTGGTSAAPALVPYNSADPAASATVLQYTVNPTAGTGVGPIWTGWIDSPVITTADVGLLVNEVNFLDTFGQPLTLRGVNEVVAWNFNGAALPAGLSVLAYVVWYEQSKT